MRCKQGDLVMVIKSDVGNEGKIGRAIEFVGDVYIAHGDVYSGKDMWLVEMASKGITVDADDGSIEMERYIPFNDASLRPISGIPDTEAENKEKELEK